MTTETSFGCEIVGGGIMRRMAHIKFLHSYEDIISIENLLNAWQEFMEGKRNRRDVQEFQFRLTDNILALHYCLKNKTYIHGPYEAFKINDPKSRDIHKATVRDRVLHRALYRRLYPFFDRTFISDSYSCRLRKGTHKVLRRFHSMAYRVGKNNTRQCFVLKCDIRKFFASIDHEILLVILQKRIPDADIMELIRKIVDSFHSTKEGVGLPLGNLTSQLFVNIYMNEFDQFVKHKLKARQYIRYADDFVIFSHDKNWLAKIVRYIAQFLRTKLRLSLHPNKVSIQTLASGIDFLGWVHFPDHRVLRTSTKRRMLRTLAENERRNDVVRSYVGLLKHGNAQKITRKIESGMV